MCGRDGHKYFRCLYICLQTNGKKLDTIKCIISQNLTICCNVAMNFKRIIRLEQPTKQILCLHTPLYFITVIIWQSFLWIELSTRSRIHNHARSRSEHYRQRKSYHTLHESRDQLANHKPSYTRYTLNRWFSMCTQFQK